MKAWEYGALDIHDPQRSTLRRYFELLSLRLPTVTGNVLEFGVSTGRSLVTTALIVSEISPDAKVFGYDSFSGFPESSLDSKDSVDMFFEMEMLGKISREHIVDVRRNLELVLARSGRDAPDAMTISKSGDFSGTSRNLVERKLAALGLGSQVTLVDGDFTIRTGDLIPDGPISAVLMDSDLFRTYSSVLKAIWPSLSSNGFVYLDEYYSLKFPGPRLAVDEFISRNKDAKLRRLEDWLDFERWILEKA